MTHPIGTAVRHHGALAAVVRNPMPVGACWTAIEYVDQPGIRLVKTKNIQYVAASVEEATRKVAE